MVSRQLQEIQNKTNFENRHLVFSIFKKKQENNGVGDISLHSKDIFKPIDKITNNL